MKTNSHPLHKFISVYIYFSFHLMKATVCKVVDPPPYVPLENIALDCGSTDSETFFFGGRNWTADARSKFSAPNLHSHSTVSTATSFNDSIGIPRVPYKTARIFHSKFTYTFNVTPGPKFVRLHFYPSSYSGLDSSEAFLSLTDGDNRTLLYNFSATLAANFRKVRTIVKEFIIQVQNSSLQLTFSPSSNDSDAFSFVNGIEVVSMPLHLYAKAEDVPLPFVGYPEAVIYMDNTTALETVYRINVGGNDVSPRQDSGMFRTWMNDEQYIYGAAFGVRRMFDFDRSVKYTSAVPAYTAPDSVYRTGRFMGPSPAINLNYNLSWFFPVETGFMYLVRLHFCEIDPYITKINQRVFRIYINNQTAENQADIIGWSGGQGVPVYKDYIVMIPQVRESTIQDLWLELHPNSDSIIKSEYYDATLNGAEIFKLSDYDGNLAGSNPHQQRGLLVNPLPESTKRSLKKRSLVIIIGCLLGGMVSASFILCIAFWIKASRERTVKKNTFYN